MKNLLKILCAAFTLTASAVEFGDIAADYPLYLANDPFAIGLARTNAAVKVNISGGASTNQTLMTATVPTFMSFTTNTVGVLSAGQISWDSDWRTFKLGLGNGVENQVGQESQKLAKNVWTNTIPNGWAVMRSGAVGNSGKFEIVPAIATVGMSQGRVVGVATEDIAVGALGLVTIRGNVNQIGSNGSLYGSSGWLDMADLYLSHVHQGYLMTNPPPAPYTVVFMGSVINAANNGAIDVSVHCGTSMQDLNDVDGTPLTQSGQFPVWDNVRQVFDFTGNIDQFLTEEADTLALAALANYAATSGASRVMVSADSWYSFTPGTATLWRVVANSASVTFSSDFEYAQTHATLYPTTQPFPIDSSGFLSSEIGPGSFEIAYIPEETALAKWECAIPDLSVSAVFVASPAYPDSVGEAYYHPPYISTNLVANYYLPTTPVLTAGDVTNIVVASIPAVNPYSQTLYGAVSVTNTEGYAGFIATNGTETLTTLVPSLTAGTNTVAFAFPLLSDRLVSASCVTYAGLGVGMTIVDSTLVVYNGETPVASNSVTAVRAMTSSPLAYFTNVVSVAGDIVTNGSVRLFITLGKGTGVGAATVSTGGSTPMTLTLQRAPLNYVTFQDLNTKVDASTVTNIVSAKLTGYVPTSQLSLTNGTIMADGVLNGTNGLFLVPFGSTNRYWILGGQ